MYKLRTLVNTVILSVVILILLFPIAHAAELPTPAWQTKTYSYVMPVPNVVIAATATEQGFWTKTGILLLEKAAIELPSKAFEEVLKKLGMATIGKLSGLVFEFFDQMKVVGVPGKSAAFLVGNGGVTAGKVIVNKPYLWVVASDPGDGTFAPDGQLTIQKKTGAGTWETISTYQVLTPEERSSLSGIAFQFVPKQEIIFSQIGTYRVFNGIGVEVEVVPEALTSVDVYSGNLGATSPGVPSGGATFGCLNAPTTEVSVQWWYGNATGTDKSYTTHVYLYEKDLHYDDLIASWSGTVNYPADSSTAASHLFNAVPISWRTCIDLGGGEFYAKVIIDKPADTQTSNSQTSYANEQDAGDSCATAVPVAPIPGKNNVVVAGKLEKNGDIDYFSYDVTKPGRLTITAQNYLLEPLDADITGFLTDSNCATLKSREHLGLFDGYNINRDVAPGTYYIAALDQSGHGAGGFYMLDIAFTPLDTPTVTTGAATDYSQTSATLNATVNPQGAAATVYFEYGTTAAYGSRTTDQSIGNPSVDTPISAVISNLACGTTYHYRAVIVTASGSVNGGDATFTACTSVPGSGVIQLPETGQTTSYAANDDGALQKGMAWPNLRFTNNDDGTVTDKLTGLIWLKNTNCTETSGGITKINGNLTWADALSWSNNLTSGKCGLTDGSVVGQWRLPNRNEMQSLIDRTNNEPSLPDNHPFINIPYDYNGHAGTYWTSTTFVYDSTAAWVIDLIRGFVYDATKNASNYVWPVRSGNTVSAPSHIPKTGQTISYQAGDDGDLQKGASWPVPRFTDNNNGTITDHLTGLIWTKNADCTNGYGYKNWFDAINAVNSIASGGCGLTDGSTAGQWRLPNVIELSSILDMSQSSPALTSIHPFSNVMTAWRYWTSTHYYFDERYGYPGSYSIDLMAGRVAAELYSIYNYNDFVWPVRNIIQPLSLTELYISPSATSNGTIICTPNPVTIGTNSTCTLTPAVNYHLAAFTVNGVDKLPQVVNNKYTITNITANQQVEATFSLNTYAISSSSTGNGTITCNPTATHGFGAACTVTPSSGYLPITPLGGTCPAGTLAGTSYTTGPVTAPCTVIASFTPGISPSAALGITGTAVTSGGSAPWTGQSAVMHNGSPAAQSPPTGDNQSSYIQTTLVGPGVASFWWKVSSEAGGDFLRFYLDGVEQTAKAPAISGQVDWAQVADIPIPPGNHTLRWAYVKNGASAAGSDAGWVGEVLVTPVPVLVAPTDISASAGNGQATVSFAAPANTVNGVVTTYTVTANPGNITATGTASPIVVTGLTNGKAYTFTVTAANIAGTGVASAPSSAVTPAVPVNGICGSSNGKALKAAPSSNLCTVGTASSVTGTGPWNWSCSGSNGGTTATCTATVTTWTVTASVAGGNGAINCVSPVNNGASSTCTIIPVTGYHLAAFTVGGADKLAQVSNNSYTIASVTANQTVTASFAINKYSITTSADATGVITPTATVNHGANATVMVTPTTGYHLATVTVDGAVQTITNPLNWSFTFTAVTAAHTVNATFASDTFAVSFISGGNGSLTGIASQTVNYNANCSAVIAVPANGFHFVNWTGTGGFVTTTTNPLTIINVTAAQTITANFAPDPLNGVCGSVNGTSVLAAPTTNLCGDNSLPAVTTTTTGWSWSCTGSNGGTDASCTAQKLPEKPGDCDSSNSVTIAELQSAINMFLGLKTAESCVDQDGSGTVSIIEMQKAMNGFLERQL